MVVNDNSTCNVTCRRRGDVSDNSSCRNGIFLVIVVQTVVLVACCEVLGLMSYPNILKYSCVYIGAGSMTFPRHFPQDFPPEKNSKHVV